MAMTRFRILALILYKEERRDREREEAKVWRSLSCIEYEWKITLRQTPEYIYIEKEK